MAILQHNSDFLFLYEATQCNPNGDPDQENKPRMDYDTDTNLVTDTRVKRYIRDYLKMRGKDIFVDSEGEAQRKVSANVKLENVLHRLFSEDIDPSIIVEGNSKHLADFLALKANNSTPEKLLTALKGPKVGNKLVPPHPELNLAILRFVVRERFIDIRMFGSAFAVEGGFNKPYIGPIQLNWGYSLHKVKLMESNTITSMMNDDSSTFGRDYRVHYSLLAFNGTINRYAAQTSGLTDDDVNTFREALWSSIPALPTRSKLNQYPKLYVEVVYKNELKDEEGKVKPGPSNGLLGDLRNYVKVSAKEGDEKAVRKLEDLTFNSSALTQAIKDNLEFIDYVIVKMGKGVSFENPKPKPNTN